MLLPGLYRYALEFFERASQSTATSAAIDQDLDWLRKLETWKKLPAKERPAGFEDDAIENAIRTVKEQMTQRSGQREVARGGEGDPRMVGCDRHLMSAAVKIVLTTASVRSVAHSPILEASVSVPSAEGASQSS